MIVMSCLCILWSASLFWLYSTRTGYDTYSAQYEARRLRPDIFPSLLSLKLVDIGHHASYADLLWVQLIQFVGDNVGGNRFLTFSHKILESITWLNPYFVRAYEIDLLFTPTLPSEGIDPTNTGAILPFEAVIRHGEKGIQALCDMEKIRQIDALPLGIDLWERKDLRNPCLSDWIAYYMWLHSLQAFKDGAKAERYYKIASMQDNAPQASRFLSILARSSVWDYRSSAFQFFLVATSGYDPEPYICRQKANEILSILAKNTPLDSAWISDVEAFEHSLESTQDEKNPLSLSADNCVDSFRRWAKQLYITYIDEVATGTEVTHASDLIKIGRIKKVPFLKDQSSGYYLIKKDGIWKYRSVGIQ